MLTEQLPIQTKETPSREAIINNAPKRFSDFPVGSVSHQGDVIFVAIPTLPASAKPRTNRQVADGSTQGSRHVVERGDVYDGLPAEIVLLIRQATGCDVDARYVGPVFVAPSDPTEHDVTHPEHGHQGFPAGTVVACAFQRNLDAEQRERRTRD